MSGLDGTGPAGRGPMTGGRRGLCVDDATIPRGGHGMGYSRHAGFGPGYRNRYRATGITGWRRARMDATESVPPAPQDRLEQIEQRLEETQARLTRLEGAD